MNSRHQGTVWQLATRVGLSTFLACIMLSALTVLPYLAQAQDFGHSHPEGTAQHIHELDAVLITAPVAPITIIEDRKFAETYTYCKAKDIISVASYDIPQSRAPPSTIRSFPTA